jgi:hypothetical protein
LLTKQKIAKNMKKKNKKELAKPSFQIKKIAQQIAREMATFHHDSQRPFGSPVYIQTICNNTFFGSNK